MRYILIIYFLGCCLNASAQRVEPDPIFNKTPFYFNQAYPKTWSYNPYVDDYHKSDFWFFHAYGFKEWVIKNGVKALIKIENQDSEISKEDSVIFMNTDQLITEYFFDLDGNIDSIVYKMKSIHLSSNSYTIIDSIDLFQEFSEIPLPLTDSDKNKLRSFGGSTGLADFQTSLMRYAIDTTGLMFADINHQIAHSPELMMSYSYWVLGIQTFKNSYQTSQIEYVYNGDFFDPIKNTSVLQPMDNEYSIIYNKALIYHDDLELYDTIYFSNYYLRKNSDQEFNEFGYIMKNSSDSNTYFPLIKKEKNVLENGKTELITDLYYVNVYPDYYLDSIQYTYIQREIVKYDKNNTIMSSEVNNLYCSGNCKTLSYIEKRTKDGFVRNNYNKEGKVVNKVYFNYDKFGALEVWLIEDSKEYLLLRSTEDSLQALENRGKRFNNFEIVYR